HAQNLCALLGPGTDLQRPGEGGSAGYPGEDSFLLRQLPREPQRITTLDWQHLVNQSGVDRILGQLRDEVRRPTLHEVRAEVGMAFRWRTVGAARLPNAASQQRRIVGLANNDFGFRSFLLQHARDALERAARAHAGDPIVEPVSLEVLQN